MKRLFVPVLALGLACAFAKPVSAGLWDGLHRNSCCEPCKPACPKPACKPACPKPCGLSCEKPCAPACPKPCDPCASHCMSDRIKGMLGHFRHRDKCCDPCGSAPAAEQASTRTGTPDYSTAPRLSPVPSITPTTTMRTTRRTLDN